MNTWIGPDQLSLKLQTPLSRGHQRGKPVHYLYDGYGESGSGGILSDADDMLKYAESYMNPNQVQDQNLSKALNLSLTVQATDFADLTAPDAIAYAWFVQGLDMGKDRWYQHGGTTAGFNSMLQFQPSSNTAFVVLSSCGYYWEKVSEIADALSSKFFNSFHIPPEEK